MPLLKFFRWILMVVILVSMPEVTFSQIEIGQPFSVLIKSTVDSSGYILIKPGINKKLYKCNYQGILYLITLDTKRTIDFVLTSDPEFSPSEGLKIWSTWEDVLRFNDHSLSLEKGWASFIRLESGWNAAFEPLDVNPSLKSKIKFFFKRYDLR